MWLHVVEHVHAYWLGGGRLPLDTPGVIDQCDSPTFRAANPGLCDPSALFPHIGGTSGGGSGGGLIGRILHAIGGLL